MNRQEFITATAIILLLAFALGWFTYWLLHRFTRVAGGDVAEMDNLAQSLHEAEEARDTAGRVLNLIGLESWLAAALPWIGAAVFLGVIFYALRARAARIDDHQRGKTP